MAPVDYYLTSGVNTMSTSSDYLVWYTWNTDTNTTAWRAWNEQVTYQWTGYEAPAAPVPTAEQQAEWAEARRQADERHRHQQLERQTAEDRAEALLRAHLNTEQIAQLEAKRYFELELIKDKTRKRYRILRGRAQNILQLDEQGKPVHRFCVHSADWIPDADNMLMQKLMIEYEEERFLKTANRSAA